MASLMSDELEDSLETRLNKATNLLLLEENWEYIVGFCDLINKDVDGPQTAVRLLVHKIQSPQEKEALFALTTLEACVRNCGQRFQQEIGKFRFINEMIKVISPKYLGNQRTARVRNRCTALLYFWSQVLTQEPKIKEAYTMLKKQGLVKEDPDMYQVNTSAIPDKPIETTSHHPLPPPPTSPAASAAEAPLSDAQKNSVFEDEEKSKLLSRLLKSKNPEDLQAANRLIKNMVKQDMERTEKVTRRTHQLETVSNNVKLLSEMLQNYQPGNSTESDREIMKELSENIEKQRPALFRLASDSDERDSTGIGDILRANDEVIQVLSLYDSLINKSDVGNLLAIDDDGSNKTPVSTDPPPKKPVSKELSDLDILTSSPLTSESKEAFDNDAGISHSLLDEQLLSLGLPVGSFSTTGTTTSNNIPPVKSSHLELSEIFSLASTQSHVQYPQNSSFLGNGPLVQTSGAFAAPQSFQQHPYTGGPSFPNYHNSSNSSSGLALLAPVSLNSTKTGAMPNESIILTSTTSATLASLDRLSKSLLEETLTSSGLKPFQPAVNPTKVTLNQMGKPLAATNGGISLSTSLKTVRLGDDDASSFNNEVEPPSLADVFVPLESIRPGSKPFLTVYEKDGIKVLFHFAADRPTPDVQVVAIAVTSTSQFPVKDLSLRSSVSKDFALKMQPASSTHLPAYNPILPPSAITQVMLVAGTKQESVRLKFDITYTIDGKVTKESKEVDL